MRVGVFVSLLALAGLVAGCGRWSQPPTASTVESPTTTSLAAQSAGSVPEQDTTPPEPSYISDVRSARQDGFDRVVFEFTGGLPPSYEVAYADPPFVGIPGVAIPVNGQAYIGVDLSRTSTFNPETGEVLVDLPVVERVGEETTKRALVTDTVVATEVVPIRDFEFEVLWVIGLSSLQPFEVSTLEGPTRLVIDVAHREGVVEEGF